MDILKHIKSLFLKTPEEYDEDKITEYMALQEEINRTTNYQITPASIPQKKPDNYDVI